jgi:hypothetical protein
MNATETSGYTKLLAAYDRLVGYADEAGDEEASLVVQIKREKLIQDHTTLVAYTGPREKWLITDGDPFVHHWGAHCGGQKLGPSQRDRHNPVVTLGGKEYTPNEMYRSLSPSEFIRIDRYHPDGSCETFRWDPEEKLWQKK